MENLPQVQLSAQVSELLNNEEKPLTERFQQASLLFVSPSVPVPRKEEIVLEWLANKVCSSEDTSIKKQALDAITTCISSPRLSNCTTEIKPNFINSLLKALGELDSSDIYDAGRQCILAATACPSLQSVFCREIDVLTKITGIFCKPDVPVRLVDFCAFTNSLIDISKLCLLQNDLRSAFIASIFFDLCKASSTIDDSRNECSKTLIEATDEMLFRERNLTERFIECYPSKAAEARKSDQLASSLVSFIRRLPKAASSSADDPIDPKVLEVAFCTLQQCFLNKNPENHSRAFQVFTYLFQALGFKVKGRTSVEMKSSTGDGAIKVMSALVKVLEKSKMSLDISLDETTTLASYFTGVVNLLVNIFSPEITTETMELLTAIFHFNPLIIEPCHHPIHKLMLLPKKDEALREAYLTFLSTIFKGAEKVGRLHKVLGKLTEGLLEQLQLRVDPSLTVDEVIPLEIAGSFCPAITALPASHVLTAIKSLQFHLLYCLKNLTSSNLALEYVMGTEIVVSLLGLFIKGTKVADYSVPVVVKDKFASIVKEIEQNLVRYGEVVLDELKDYRILSSFLALCHALGAFHLFCWKYDREHDKPFTEDDLDPTNLAYVLPCLDQSGWQSVTNAVELSTSKRVKHQFYDLLMQKMEALAHLEEGLDGPGTRIARYLFEHAGADWQWNNALDLLPKLEDNELLGFVESLVSSAGRDYSRWIPIVSSPIFMDNKRLIVAVSVGLFVHIAKHINKNCKTQATCHNVMAKIAVVPLLEYELLRLIRESSFEMSICEVEIHTFLKEMSDELSKFLKKNPSPAMPSEDFCIDGYIEIISQIPFEHCSACFEGCAFLAILALLCDIPMGMNNDYLLLDKLNLILGRITGGSSAMHPGISSRNPGSALRFLARRCAKHPAHRELITRFARIELDIRHWVLNCEAIVRAVKYPTPSTLWQTTAVIRALVQVAKRENIDKEDVRVNVEHLGSVAVRVLRQEVPHPSLLEDYTVVLKHAYLSRAAAADDDEDALVPSPLPQLDGYCRIAMTNFSTGKPLIKLILKKWSFLGQFVHADFLRDLWKDTFVKSSCDIDIEVLVLFFSSLQNNDLKDVVESLKELFENSIKSNGEIDERSALRCFRVWEGFAYSDASGANGRARVEALTPLMAAIARLFASYEPPTSLITAALGLLAEIAHQSSIPLRSNVIDGMLAAMDRVAEPGSRVLEVQGAIAVLYAMWRWRRAAMADRLPALLQRFCALSTAVAIHAEPSGTLDHLALTETLALRLYKLSQEMVRDDKELGRIAPYIVADVMKVLEQHEIYSEIKTHFINILNLFFQVCDSRSLTFLSSCLPASSKELYKNYYGLYKKYQYLGKI